MKPLFRVLHLLSIFIYSILIILPFTVYLIYGFPKYLLTGTSGLEKTWMSNNFLIERIQKLDPI